jgi:hypothetical protein
MSSEELKDWFEQTAKIITDLQICLNNANRLFDTKYNNEDWVKNHGFFRHHYYQLWFIISIQLSKLLSASRNQRYNFNKLLDRLENEKLDEQLRDLIEAKKTIPSSAVFRSKKEMFDKIKTFRREIKDNEETIKRFVTSRDTIYAHRDPEAKPQNVTLSDAERLIDIVKRLYNCFRGGFYDVYFEFGRTVDWDIDFVLKQAAWAKTQRDKESAKRCNDE